MHRFLLISLALLAAAVAPALLFAGAQNWTGCRTIRANATGRIVYPFGNNYFSVENRGDQFFFEHIPGTDDEYHLFDSGGQFMASDIGGLVYRVGDRQAVTRWKVETFGVDNKQTLRSIAWNRYLQVVGTLGGLVVRTNETRDSSSASWETFTVAAGGGCAAPPNDEPSTGTTAVTETFSGRDAVRGFADLHVHQFFNYAFGGILAHGEAASQDGIRTALRSCDFKDGLIVHGVNHASDFVGLALDQGRRGSGGWPDFGGWPHWGSVDHQQVYYKWLERAWLGGLRLMSVLAVNNELLCNAEPIATARPNLFDCNDMNSVDRQIAAAKFMEAFIDDISGGPGLGWYRIAYSSQQARQIINSGKLAVVLGIEVSNLFNCNRGTCTQAQVDAAVDRYYTMGVRQVLPVHVFNNDFAGSAFGSPFFNLGNLLVNGRPFDVWDCSGEGFTFKFSQDSVVNGLFSLLSGQLPGLPTSYAGAANCNARSLTTSTPGSTLATGDYLLRRLMDRKMIIDVDHLSFLARQGALTVAEQRPMFGGAFFGYPVISSHSEPLASGRTPHIQAETSLTDSQISRIAALQGLIAPNVIPKLASDTVPFGSRIPNDCAQSTKVYAQRYLWLLDRLARAGVTNPAVAFGTDMNGFATHLAPRFGAEACAPGSSTSEPNAAQSNPVVYPFAAHGKAGTFSQQVTGTRTFDYNNDGFAHIGMYPDFIQDLKNVGLTSADLDPLFRSAEGYLRVWERVEELDFSPPAITPVINGPLSSSGWYRGNTTLSWIVTDPESGIRSSAGCSAVTLTTDTARFTQTCSAVNGVGTGSSRTVVIRLDKTAPSIACGSADGLWHGADVTLACTAADSTSGLAAPADASFTLSTAVPAGTETANAATGSRTVCDVAGNCAAGGPISGNRVDKKPPVVVIATPANGAAYLVNQAVTANYSCTDGGSGIANCSAPLAVGAAIPTSVPAAVTFTVNAQDNVGLAASASVSYNVTYNVCLLYDPAEARNGAVIPIRLNLCDSGGAALPVSATVTALRITSGAAVFPVDTAGNQGAVFRPEGAAYALNLSVKDLAPGVYDLVFSVSGDPLTHTARFTIR